MYVNKCTKCGKEFETKNPKRVICPECLYADRAVEAPAQQQEEPQKHYSSYSSYDSQSENQGGNERYQRNYSQGGGYERNNYSQGGYNRQGGGYQQRNNNYGDRRPQQRYGNNQGGGYQQRNNNYGDRRPQQRYGNNQGGGYQQRNNYGDRRPQQRYGNNQGGGYQQRGGFNNRRPGGFNNRPRPNRAPKPQKALLVNREQLEQIELLYKQMLPLPNPDAHEVIGEKIGLEPRKVFFGINLVRQKMMLPKLPFPKRKLAISPDQMQAIQSLYEPLLPLPPIGCHKIIAAQLKMDEWRVHVGIGLIRAKLGLDRWNPDRPDAPEEFKTQKEEEKPKKTTRKKKADDAEETAEEKPKKTTRKKKTEE